MRKLLLSAAAAAALLCICGIAQNKPEDVMRLVAEGKLVTLSYSLTVEADVPVLYSGTAEVQEGAFLIKGNGLEIYCDGESLFVVDPKAKEIYIEKACSIQDYISNNIGKIKDPSISDVSVQEKRTDLSCYKYDYENIDSSWIITDLR